MSYPVAIIGAGPVGLAAAAHLLERGETPLIFEVGPEAGHSIKAWGHVQMFSPWRYNMDAASKRLLESSGWTEPDLERLPSGHELVRDYLAPLAQKTSLASHIRYGQKVVAVSRQGRDKVRTKGREDLPFVVRTEDTVGVLQEHTVRAVIDASGTWQSPNFMGAAGLPLVGEQTCQDLVASGIPDVLGRYRSSYAGKTVAVIGSGHSAFNVVLELLKLKESAPETNIHWVMRKESLNKVFGGGEADALSARGALGQRAKAAISSKAVTLHTPFYISDVSRLNEDSATISGHIANAPAQLVVNRIIVTTGFRPDFSMLREIRLNVDPALECTGALGPLIDPNEHSCGTVRPHGAVELAHPDKDFYIAGMKSYGRAPTFLLATGYEQVRSIVAELVGDREAARRVELDLPETGVCSLSEPDETSAAASCCNASSDSCTNPPADGPCDCADTPSTKKSAAKTNCCAA